MTGRTLAEHNLREKDWQRKVTDTCDWLHLSWYHNPDSRRSNAGFPDLVIWGPGGFIAVELKTAVGRIRPAQTKTLLSLDLAGIETHVWRPAQYDAAHARLRELAVLPKEPA